MESVHVILFLSWVLLYGVMGLPLRAMAFMGTQVFSANKFRMGYEASYARAEAWKDMETVQETEFVSV
jgi:hypothetical protein